MIRLVSIPLEAILPTLFRVGSIHTHFIKHLQTIHKPLKEQKTKKKKTKKTIGKIRD